MEQKEHSDMGIIAEQYTKDEIRSIGGSQNQENSLLNRFWAVGAAWLIEVRSVIFSSRWIAVTLLSLFLLLFYTKEVNNFADAYHLKINPVVLPFLFADGRFGDLGLMVLIFLMSVFPFRDNLQRGIRMKAGNKCYGLVQILTMITLAVVWMTELQLLSLIIIGNRCMFGSWGKVWGSFASGVVGELGFNVPVEVDMNIILKYSPWQALLVSMFFAVLVSVIFGELIFLVDMLTGYNIGEIILAIYCFAFFALSALDLTFLMQVAGKFNPSAWMNISDYMLKEGKMEQTLLLMGSLLVVLTAADYQIIKRKIIE